MFRSLILVIAILTSPIAHAQTYKEDIKNRFLEYTQLLINKDFEKSIDYLNPAFLKIISKEQLLKMMVQTYNNPKLEFQIDQPTILSVNDKATIAGTDYVKFQYSNYLNMRFKSENGKTVDTASTKNALEKQFGQGNVTYDAATEFYRILVYKDVVANSVNSKKWTFLVIEEKQKPILEKILPKGVL